MCEFATFLKDENQWEPCWECDQCNGVEPDFDFDEALTTTLLVDECLAIGKALKKLINRKPGHLEDDLPF